VSIRLRFTLVYSAILAVTLAVFGTALYSIQAQSTLDAIKSDLIQSSKTLGESVLRSATSDKSEVPPKPQDQNGEPPPPMSFQNFSSDQGLQQIPEREIVRVLDEYGNLIASPYGRSEDVLPLSEEGLQTLQSNDVWWQIDEVKGERMLIYSKPITSDDSLTYFLQVARPLAERDTSLQILGTTLIMAIIITLAVAFGIGWLFSGFILKPIKLITQTAQSIGEQNDLGRRVEYIGPQDEVGLLTTTFNSMLARLQDSYQRVAHSLEVQRNFVADVSHELRTPLTTLRGNLELLRRKPAIPQEERLDIQDDMVDESDRLIRLVNDLLTLARADAERSLTLENMTVLPILQECVRQSLILYEGRKVSINVPKGLSIRGDKDAFKQILIILLDNALKYSDGLIALSAEKKEDQVEIRVQDNGIGLTPEKLEHVFDRFYRNSETSSASGFGLGLAIAKSLVEAQSGDISMTSEVGKGSEVILHFPSSD